MNLDHLKDMNVLYVEDDENIASGTITLLEKFFHKIYHRNNAEDGLEVIKNEAVDILITDIELPSMSGLTLCEEIRKVDHNLPIFITTMHDDYNTLKKAIRLNLVDFLVKPINVSTMMNALSETLNRIDYNNDHMTRIGDNIDFYPSSGELIVSDKKVNLTKYELKLLTFLAKHKNNLVTRNMIEDVLDYEETMTDAAHKNLIYRLRKKIGKDALHTVVGVGVKLKI
jgi:DNA-binding response OmpR family regulator